MTDQWLGLDLRLLTALQAIADEGSFKSAARALGYTPSAISQQIASLERIVGVQVIAREHGRQALGLTEAGRILLRHMSAIEARLAAAKSEIDAFAQGIVGTLRVGAYESVVARLLPGLIGRFRESFPRVRVEVDDALSDLELLRSLERGILDVAFTLLPLPPGPFQTRTVLHDPWVLVVQAGSQYVELSETPLSLRSIGRLPLVCFRAPRAIDPVLSRFRAAGVEPNIVLRSDYNDAIQEFAAAGLGVAVMPRLAVNPHDQRMVMVDLDPLIPSREIVLAWHNDRTESEAIKTFVTLAAEMGSGLEHDRSNSRDWRRSAAV